jgi:hypothetical protein
VLPKYSLHLVYIARG